MIYVEKRSEIYNNNLLFFSSIQKQMAFMLNRQQIYLELDGDENSELTDIMTNAHLNNHFLNLGREVIYFFSS